MSDANAKKRKGSQRETQEDEQAKPRKGKGGTKDAGTKRSGGRGRPATASAPSDEPAEVTAEPPIRGGG